jgi:hypothetical protein
VGRCGFNIAVDEKTGERPRKKDDGSVVLFSPKDAKLRYFETPAIYLEKEVKEFKNLTDRMKERSII